MVCFIMKHNTKIAVLILIHIIQTTIVMIKTAKIMHPVIYLHFIVITVKLQ